MRTNTPKSPVSHSDHNSKFWLSTILLFVSSCLNAAQVVPVVQLQAAPVLDGTDEEWRDVSLVSVPMRKTKPKNKTEVDQVAVKAGVFDDYVYLYLTWKDDSESIEHKPFIWDDKIGKYMQQQSYEDRVAIQFEMTGDYTTNWLSGKSFTADMWHWKAFRSNTVGLVHDKKTVVSSEKLLRSYSAVSDNGNPIYIQRPSDDGDRLYKSQRLTSKQEEKMPKYILYPNPQGSVADIRAKGVWQNGVWHVEMVRKLRTGHQDDVEFKQGVAVKAGIAVFNATGDDDHTVSDTLIFQF